MHVFVCILTLFCTIVTLIVTQVSCCYHMTYLTVILDGFQLTLLHIPGACASKCTITFIVQRWMEMSKTHEAQ